MNSKLVTINDRRSTVDDGGSTFDVRRSTVDERFRNERPNIERPSSIVERRTSIVPGFTILELLIVLGIMVLLFGLAIPAMNNLTRANAVNSGSTQLANILILARQQAVTRRTNVRVVFANALNNSTTNGALHWQSYAVLLQTNRAVDAIASWIYVDRWQMLPKGAFFSGLPTVETSDVPFPTNGTTAATLIPYVEFRPNGSLKNPTSDLDITVKEGAIVGTTLVNSNHDNRISTRIYAITGKVKVMR